LEQLQFCIGIFVDDDNEIPSFNTEENISNSNISSETEKNNDTVNIETQSNCSKNTLQEDWIELD